jgi:predicted regulator of Ras-like GTPase activity (Roadblock/LC7/MglB family)
MPYQSLLDQLARDVDGVLAALLLDSEGEVAVESGAPNDRHRLIGAYQGIALTLARKTNARHGVGGIRLITCRYRWGQVILRPLKDGYYLVVSLSSEVQLARGIDGSALVQERLNAAL